MSVFDQSRYGVTQGNDSDNSMTLLPSYDCNGTGAQNWLLNRGNTKVQLGGTVSETCVLRKVCEKDPHQERIAQNFCLDAGSNPASGVGAKICECL